MVQVTFVYIDACSEAQQRALLSEIHDVIGTADDPLEILIRGEEPDFDVDRACRYLNALHATKRVRPRYERGCTYPECYKPCRHCRCK